MTYWMFIIQLLLLSCVSHLSYAQSSFMKAYDSENNLIKDGIGVLKPGQTITIECAHEGSVKWSVKDIDNKRLEKVLTATAGIKIVNNKLTVTNVKFEDAGIYYCEQTGRAYSFALHVYEITKATNGSVAVKEINEEVNNVEFKQLKIDEKTSANVSCSCVSGSEKATGEISWRGGKYSKMSELYNVITKKSGTMISNTLVLVKADNDPELYGEYKCSCNVISGLEQTRSVYLSTPPIFHKYDSSHRTSEGVDVTLTCNVWAFPALTQGSVNWRFQNSSALRPGIEVRLNDTNHGFVQLFIPKVSQSDRGLYTCHAANSVGSNIAGVMVRIKGKYAALWPFLGIVVQLIILTVIIVVYELKKKRDNKTISDESAAAISRNANYDSKPEFDANTGEKITDPADVRQRLVKA